MISVIVPVYKVEEYLDKCVQSIVDQTYTDLEIILVDDGSPDNCPAMCDAWAKKDSRIKVIHKVNGGLSDARNAGMAVATGEYIGFVDSDDWIAPNMYELLYNRMIQTNSDITSCGILRVWPEIGKKEIIFQGRGDQILQSASAMKAIIQSTYLIMMVMNKLYRRTVIQNISFLFGKINEDEYWSWQAIANASRVATIEECAYFYNQRDNSIMRSNVAKNNLLNVIEAKCQRHEYIRHNIPELSNESCWNLLGTCQYQGQVMMRSFPYKQIKEHISYIKKVIQEHPVSKDFFSALSFRRKIRYLMIQYCFVSMCRLQNLLHIGM